MADDAVRPTVEGADPFGRAEIALRGRRLTVDLFYPRNDSHANEVEVGISDVRAADSILVSYDFERDGYSIKQASVFEWDADDEVMDQDWREVAFVPAWARDPKHPAPSSVGRSQSDAADGDPQGASGPKG